MMRTLCLSLLGAALLLAVPGVAAASTESQTKQLLDTLIPYAHGALERANTFVPFGGGLDPQGKVHFMQGEAPRGQKLGTAELRGLLVDSLTGLVQEKGFTAAAVISETNVRDPKTKQLVRAIQADLRFRQGKSETLYIPFTQNASGKVSFRPSFKLKGDGDLR